MGDKNYNIIKELFLSKKVFLIDGDGTLYLWDKPFKSSTLFLGKLGSSGKKFVILSNNDSESKVNRLKFLSKIFKKEIKEDQLFLPNEIVEEFMHENRIKRFDGLISNDFRKELEREGFVYDEKSPQIVIIGFDVDLTYEKLKRIIKHVNSGIKFILTHIDPLCPYKNGSEIPDAGLMVNLVNSATNRAPSLIFGKPFISTIRYITKKYGYTRKDMLMIGDRLNTDIKMATESGISSIWIKGKNQVNKTTYLPTAEVLSLDVLYQIISDL
jgi:HAD superfamily hydrolase (TIGR01450 family)